MVSFKKTTSILLFALLCISINAHEEYECNHDSIKQNPGTLFIEEDLSSLNKNGRVLQDTTYSNIRIKAYYGYLQETAPSDYAAYIQTVVQPAIDYFQAALKVKYPVVGNLQVASSVSTICERSTPSELYSGVPADFYIYYDSEAASGSQIANTAHCYLASGTGRTLIGRTMINRNMMPNANGDVLVHEKNMLVLMHEMTHAFGFSSSLFKHFIDANAQPLSGHIKTVSVAGSSRTVLDVSPLTDKLRNYYGCSTLPGAILENNGGDSTASSHFERKYFLYEFMCSGSIFGRRISEFSLALLEGSGWYAIDYSYAEPFFFGQGQGCDFINNQCGSSSTAFPDDYCTESTMGCTPHGMGGGFCSSDSIMDSCKYYYPAESNYCENPDGADNTRLGTLQVYGRGLGSRCFAGTLNTRQSNSIASFCFKYTCSGSGTDTQLTVQVGDNTVTCTEEGEQTIDGYYGAINCPDPMTFCNGAGVQFCPRNCMGRGTCVNGQCQCNSGYSGTDCALSA